MMLPTIDNRFYLNAAADGDHRRLSGRRGDRDGAHLVVQTIVVSVVNDKVKDVGDGLAARLQGGDVPAHDDTMERKSEHSSMCFFFLFCNHLLLSNRRLVYLFSAGLTVDSATLCILRHAIIRPLISTKC